MRLILLAAVLATACDQGATAGPRPEQALVIATPEAPKPIPTHARYVVRDDADFAVKAIAVLEELFAIFNDGSKDCEVIATRVENFGARNVTRFAVLTAYGKAHPGAEKALQEQFKPQLEKLVSQMTPILSTCMQNQRVMAAFTKLADAANTQAFQQRPR